MADNRRIKNKLRGESGQHFNFGMEDQLAAAVDQTRLDQLKAEGAIEGDWRSTKSPMVVTGDGAMSKGLSKEINESGASVTTGEPGDKFKPLSARETLEAMRRMDFSETVTRSMTFHGAALKEAMKADAGGALQKSGEKSAADGGGEADDFPEGFPSYGKIALKKLGKTYAEIKDLNREQLIEIDGIAEKSADEILAFVASFGAGNKGDK